MIRHNYIDIGEGKPLILLHGNGADGSYFIHQINYFSSKYRVIAVDSRGHGKTPRGEKPFTLLQFSEDLHAFLDTHAIKRAHILGFSDGANVAIRFAIDYPGYVDKLILSGANLKYSSLRISVRMAIRLLEKANSTFSGDKDNQTRRSELLQLMKGEPVTGVDELERIQAETLVIAGTMDLMYGSHTKLIASKIPNSRLEFVKGNHSLARRSYKAFNEIIDDFLQG